MGAVLTHEAAPRDIEAGHLEWYEGVDRLPKLIVLPNIAPVRRANVAGVLHLMGCISRFLASVRGAGARAGLNKGVERVDAVADGARA